MDWQLFGVYGLWPLGLSLALGELHRRQSPRRFWTIGLSAGAVLTLCVLVAGRPYAESSPIAVALSVAAPFVLAMSCIVFATPRWGRVKVGLLAAAATSTTLPLAYMGGCLFAELLPFPRCFF